MTEEHNDGGTASDGQPANPTVPPVGAASAGQAKQEPTPRPTASEIDDLAEEVERMLQFAISHALVKVGDDVIREALDALATPAPRNPDESTKLWAVYNRLASLVHPATSESIHLIQDFVDDERKRSGKVRWYCKDVPARRLVSCNIWWVLGTLVVLVICQFYSLALTSVLDEIRDANTRYEAAAAAHELVKETLVATTTPTEALKMQESHLDAAEQKAGDDVNASYALLLRVAFWAKHLIPDDVDDAPFREINTKNISQAFLKGFALYLVPLIYGLLGANVYILRQIMTGLDGWTLSVLSKPMYSLRRALGALVGATFGLLFDSPDKAIADTGFSLAALAFLGGYSAELFFTLLDTFIEKGKAAFSSSKAYAPVENPGNPKPAGN